MMCMCVILNYVDSLEKHGLEEFSYFWQGVNIFWKNCGFLGFFLLITQKVGLWYKFYVYHLILIFYVKYIPKYNSYVLW